MKSSALKRHLPRNCKLPALFGAFLRTDPPFEIRWRSPVAFEFKPSAKKEVFPFLQLSDGGVIALWYCEKDPAVVHLGSEGEQRVIASNFENFLKGLNTYNTDVGGLDCLDETAPGFRIPGVSGKPAKDALRKLNAQFKVWVKKETALLEPLHTADTEALRHRLTVIALQMVRDGLYMRALKKAQPLFYKEFKALSDHWSIDFKIQRVGARTSIKYLDYGRWYPVPKKKYGLDKEVESLLKLVKNKKRKSYELNVSSFGIVSINRDQELVLVSPEAEKLLNGGKSVEMIRRGSGPTSPSQSARYQSAASSRSSPRSQRVHRP